MIESTNTHLCSSCIHREICKLKDTYLKAQKAVNDARFFDVDSSEGVQGVFISKLSDWLTIPQLGCKHYQEEGTIR